MVSTTRVIAEKISEPRDTNPSLTPMIVVATFLALFSVGMVTSSWGSTISFIKSAFAVSDSTVGLLGTAQFLGGVLGNISTGLLEKRLLAGRRMGLGIFLFGCGCLVFFLAKLWVFALFAALLLGFGLGMFQVDYASLFSRGFGKRSDAVMNVMSTSYSFGSILGPLVVVLLLERFQLMFLAVALFSVIAIFVMLPARDTALKAHAGEKLSISPKVFGFIALAFFYVCSEVGLSFWLPTYLQTVGFDLPGAAKIASWFWIAITLGRLLAIPISLRFSGVLLLTVCLFCSVVSLLTALIPGLAAPAFIATGLFMAPIFPAGMVWINREYSSVGASSVYLVSGSLGALLIAPSLGKIKELFGAGVLPPSLALCALISLLAALWLRSLPKTTVKSV